MAYGGIALAQARGGDLAGARATLAKTRDDDERRSFGKAWTCARIASLRAEAGDIEGAKVLAAEAGPWRGPADHDIVKAQVKHGDIAGAKKMAARMDDERCVIEAYVTIAEAEAQHGQLADARRTIDKAEAAAVRAKDDDGACRYIAPAREKMGDLAGAIATATKFGAWRDVASLQAKTGDVDAARKTWKKAITAAQRARERSSIDAALAGIVNDQIGVGELASAKETASSITGERTRRDACNAIVSRQALVGDVAAAIEYASSLADDPVTRCVRLVEAANAVCPPDQVREPR